jgi:DNA-binding transcriptional regulator PaaX
MERAEKIDYRKIILAVIGLTGVIALATVAPNCIQLLRFLPHQKSKKRYYIQTVITRLINHGLLKVESNHRGHKIVKLTEQGKSLLKKYKMEDLSINKPKKWDSKYRVIIFDIKEWKRGTRDELRSWFEKLGLIRLQNSVWVYPYECREIIALLKANYRIGNEVLYMEVTHIENDRWLKKAFNLN